jgi:superfamily II DNA/RNA helicase
VSEFKDFNLDQAILTTLTEIGYSQPTPIQADAIPLILAGKDIIATSQTGSGKTGAFLIPTIHNISLSHRGRKDQPRALVLAPTRELALQIADEARKFCGGLRDIQVACVFGGVPYPVQRKQLARGCDLLVATPGRLIDLIGQGKIDLSKVEILILDEADRMLDMGFIGPVEEIAEGTPLNRQTLLFSATFDKRVKKLSENLQNDPSEVRIEADLSSQGKIDQQFYFVDGYNHKMSLLEHFLQDENFKQGIVFTSTKRQADTLADHLDDLGYSTAPLHGDIKQRERTRTINKMKDGEIQILVATDVAARGIDVSNISHVLNFDLPDQVDDFIHRTGRTGRAGASGTAISFCAYNEKGFLKEFAKLTGEEIVTLTVPGLEPKPPKANMKPAPQRGARGNGGRSFGGGARKSYSDDRGPDRGERKSYSRDRDGYQDRKPRSPDERSAAPAEGRPFERKPRSFEDRAPTEGRSFERRPRAADDAAPAEGRSFERKPRSFEDRAPTEGRSFGEKSFGERRTFGDKKPFGDRPERKSFGDKKPFESNRFSGPKKPREDGAKKEFGGSNFSRGPKGPRGPRRENAPVKKPSSY